MDLSVYRFLSPHASHGVPAPVHRARHHRTLWALFGLLGWTLVRAELPPLRHATVVIAHRGEHRRHHENTLEAIQGAIDCGADFTEMDVRRSLDGRYMIMHDSTVDRMTDGHGNVADLSWEELSKLKVQSRLLTNVPPSRIPLFEEALKLARGKIHVYVDFKAGDRAIAADIIRAAHMAGGVLIYDNTSGVTEWKRIAPEFPVITSPPDRARTNFTVMRAFVERYRPDVLDQAPEPKWMPQMQKLPVKIWPDIQRNDENPAYWQPIWDRGIRGFQTDYPAELAKWLEQTGRR
jgi:glycerophosphoryl diester phosphodiesterase